MKQSPDFPSPRARGTEPECDRRLAQLLDHMVYKQPYFVGDVLSRWIDQGERQRGTLPTFKDSDQPPVPKCIFYNEVWKQGNPQSLYGRLCKHVTVVAGEHPSDHDRFIAFLATEGTVRPFAS